MVAIDALLLCDAATRDPKTGKWTLAGIFDALWAKEFPVSHHALDVYFRLRAPGPATLRLFLRAPSGAPSMLATVAATPSARGLVGGSVRIAGLRLDEPGDYRFELETDGRTIGESVLAVGQLPPPASTLH